jgi:transposase
MFSNCCCKILTGHTVNSEFYRKMVDQLLKRLWLVRLDKAQSGNWFLLHNNAPSHSATIVKQFLTKERITVLHHPHYLPDLAPVDY